MSQSRIRAAFESRLAAWAGAKQIPVIWQNTKHTLPKGPHLRAFLLPAQTVSNDLAGDHRGYRGVFQISIFCKTGTGSQLAESIAAELEALFPALLHMPASGISVYVASPLSASPAIQETDWYSIALSCRYRAETIA